MSRVGALLSERQVTEVVTDGRGSAQTPLSQSLLTFGGLLSKKIQFLSYILPHRLLYIINSWDASSDK